MSWGFRTDSSGKRLWDWTNRNNLTCLDSRVPTFVRCNSRSVLDLAFASSNVTKSSWTVLDTATSSDHRPVVFEVSIPIVTVVHHVQSFVDYSKFKKNLQSALSSMPSMERNVKAMSLCSTLKRTIKKSQFTVSSTKGNSISAWWNSDCARDYRRRKAAWKKLRANQCPAN